MKTFHTLVIGGGQAGLSASFYLGLRQVEHLVLEQAAQAGHAWRYQRWDSFTLVTPNWTVRLPGAEYQGNAPDGFMSRNELIASFERYIERFRIPIQFGTRVLSISLQPDATGYLVQTSQGDYLARNVIMATGLFQVPKTPPFAAGLSSRLTQLAAPEYRNPGQLPDGGVLVVGSAQSGAQIAEELNESGRNVYLAVGGAGRVPRRYRGKDIVYWMNQIGFFDRTAGMLESPRQKFAANPHGTGKNGGHTINLHLFARNGIQLLGHALGGDHERLLFADDLLQSLAKTDQFEADILHLVDSYIKDQGIAAPREELIALQDGYHARIIRELSPEAANINSIIWALGFSFDYSLVKLPVTDADGFPLTHRGVTEFPGLYFLGMPFLYKQKSGLLYGVGEDAAYLVDHLKGQN